MSLKHRSVSGIGSGSSGGGISRGGFGARLKGFDLYRKVPKDLTEASAIGGIISIVFSTFFLLLLVLEIRNFLSVKDVTSIVVDHTEDGILQVNFNLTFEKISCEFIGIDVENVIGKKRHNIEDKTVHKYSMDGTFQGYADSDGKADLEHLYEGTPKDHYNNQRYAIELTSENIQEYEDKFEVLLVDFHAPWCVHCQNLSPIWQHAAHIVKEKADAGFDGHHKHSIALASLDCTNPKHRPTCLANHIQAFPTILVFRQGKNNIVSGARGKYYEAYSGEREAQKIADFAFSVLKEVQAKDKAALPVVGHDADKDGVLDSKVHTQGCRVDGYLILQRVPGSIIFRPKSTGHSFSTGLANLDHKIHHLSFGNRKQREARRKLVSESMEGAYSEKVGRPVILAEGEDEVGFMSNAANTTFEHFIKVVSTQRVPLGSRPPIHYFEYTLNSNSHSSEHGTSEVFLTYDLSPLKVLVKEEAKPWIEGLTGMFAILGGFFSCSIIIESILASLIGLTKKLD